MEDTSHVIGLHYLLFFIQFQAPDHWVGLLTRKLSHCTFIEASLQTSDVSEGGRTMLALQPSGLHFLISYILRPSNWQSVLTITLLAFKEERTEWWRGGVEAGGRILSLIVYSFFKQRCFLLKVYEEEVGKRQDEASQSHRIMGVVSKWSEMWHVGFTGIINMWQWEVAIIRLLVIPKRLGSRICV